MSVSAARNTHGKWKENSHLRNVKLQILQPPSQPPLLLRNIHHRALYNSTINVYNACVPPLRHHENCPSVVAWNLFQLTHNNNPLNVKKKNKKKIVVIKTQTQTKLNI